MKISTVGGKRVVRTEYGFVAYDPVARTLVVRDQDGKRYPPAIEEQIFDIAIALANEKLQGDAE